MTGASYHLPIPSTASIVDDPTTSIFELAGSELPVYLMEGTPDGDKEFYPGKQLKEHYRVLVTGRYDVAEPVARERQAAGEKMAADVEVAVEGGDLTFGGIVEHAKIGTPQIFFGLGSGVVLMVMPVTATIWRQYGSP